MRLAEFKNMNRVTVMPVVNVDGEDGPCLFVFKGMSLPDRKVLRAGRVSVKTWAQFLPRNAVTSTRAEFGGVDGYNFFEWAKEFVEYVKPDTDHGRKVLLTYDGYRSLIAEWRLCIRFAGTLFRQNAATGRRSVLAL